jgi:hypothetical protein
VCENKNIIATNGISYAVCVPYVLFYNLRQYIYPPSFVVSGGTLKRIGTTTNYEFIKAIVNNPPIEPGNCETKDIRATNGLSYRVCVPYVLFYNVRQYIYPPSFVVSGGTLKRLGTSNNYEFIKTPVIIPPTIPPTVPPGEASQWIKGIKNEYLVIGGLAVFLLLGKD